LKINRDLVLVVLVSLTVFSLVCNPMNDVFQKLLDEIFGFKASKIVARIIESKGPVTSSGSRR